MKIINFVFIIVMIISLIVIINANERKQVGDSKLEFENIFFIYSAQQIYFEIDFSSYY